MKKYISALLVAVLLISVPTIAQADDSVLISGEYVDPSGAPVSNVSFRFNFSNSTSASGTSDANGKFLVTGIAGKYTVAVGSNSGSQKCISAQFEGSFVPGRDTFKLVLPKEVQYSLQVLDRTNQKTHNARWSINYGIFKAVSNPQFENPVFKCYSIYAKTSSSNSGTGSLLDTFELDVEAMQAQALEGKNSRPIARATYADSVSGSSSVEIPLEKLNSPNVSIAIERLPSIKIENVGPVSKSKTYRVGSSIAESDFYQGLTIPRTVTTLWRWQRKNKPDKWVSWRTLRPVSRAADGKFYDSFSTKFTPAEKPGTKIEVKVIGSNFGSMSPSFTFKVK